MIRLGDLRAVSTGEHKQVMGEQKNEAVSRSTAPLVTCGNKALQCALPRNTR